MIKILRSAGKTADADALQKKLDSLDALQRIERGEPPPPDTRMIVDRAEAEAASDSAEAKGTAMVAQLISAGRTQEAEA